jgi:polar amino acid transport system permease protein
MSEFFDIGIVVAAWPMLWRGLATTLLLSALVVPLGLLSGLGLALLSTLRSRVVRYLVIGWTDLFRAFPPLVLLILLYGGLPFAGLELGGVACMAIAFFLNTGSYYGEVIRAGIESIPPGQSEAARSLGLGVWATLRKIILPQALRQVLPDLVSNTLEVVKLTSLASVVAVPELLYQARQAQSLTYNPSPIFAAAVLYALALWPIVKILRRLEQRAVLSR